MQQHIWKSIAQKGLYAGAILAGIFLLTYVLNVEMFNPLSWLLNTIVQLAVVLIFSYVAVSETRQLAEDKKLTFLQALALSSGVIMLALLIQYAVSVIIIYGVDPDYAINQYKELMQDVARQTNNDPETMEKMRLGLKKMENVTVGSVLMGLIFPLIETIILSIIVALTAKKKEHYEDSLNAM